MVPCITSIEPTIRAQPLRCQRDSLKFCWYLKLCIRQELSARHRIRSFEISMAKSPAKPPMKTCRVNRERADGCDKHRVNDGSTMTHVSLTSVPVQRWNVSYSTYCNNKCWENARAFPLISRWDSSVPLLLVITKQFGTTPSNTRSRYKPHVLHPPTLFIEQTQRNDHRVRALHGENGIVLSSETTFTLFSRRCASNGYACSLSGAERAV